MRENIAEYAVGNIFSPWKWGKMKIEAEISAVHFLFKEKILI